MCRPASCPSSCRYLLARCCAAGGVKILYAQVHVLNGEKYREVCPENTLLNSMQLRGCIISPQAKKPLLKRESALGVSEETRIFLEVEVRHRLPPVCGARVVCLCVLVAATAHGLAVDSDCA